MKQLALSIGTVLAVLAGCGGTGDEARWSPVTADALEGAQAAQHDRAVAARDAMFGALMQRVSAELAASGPPGTIRVCQEAAPAIAESIAREHGVRIGRTSWKLRNAQNAPPAWAQPLLADRPEEERLAVGPDGQLGVTLPIRVLPGCLACHGAPETLDPAVAQTLAETYPDDRATGFEAGDLRGWFWVEVPAAGG